MKKVLVLFSLLLLVSVFALGATYRIGLSLSTLNNPFFVTLRDGALDMAGKLGVEVIVADAQDNPAKQLSDIEDFIQQRLDLIIINQLTVMQS